MRGTSEEGLAGAQVPGAGGAPEGPLRVWLPWAQSGRGVTSVSVEQWGDPEKGSGMEKDGLAAASLLAAALRALCRCSRAGKQRVGVGGSPEAGRCPRRR